MSAATLFAGREPLLADGFDQGLQLGDMLAEPCQFLGCDLVMRRIARIHISLPQQFETTPREAIFARSRGDQRRRNLLALRAQEIQPVRLRTVERERKQGAVVKTFNRLMEIKRCFFRITF